MKWFQTDSDTPDDPRIQAVLAQFGNAGLGALFRLWCFVARHGRRRPGWSLDTSGRPIAKSFLVQATGLSEHDFDLLLSELARNGHISRQQWNNRRVIAIPAMAKRADTYTQRRLRTPFERSSKFVPLQDNTRQDNTSNKNSAAKHAAPDPAKNYRVVLRLVHDLIDKTPAADRDFVSLKDAAKTACAKAGIDYDADVVGRALESALASHGKKAVRA